MPHCSAFLILVVLVLLFILLLIFPAARLKLLVATALYLLGLYYSVASHHYIRPLPVASHPVSIIAVIASIPQRKKRSVRFYVDLVKMDKKKKVAKLLLNWYGANRKLRVADLWQLKVKLKPLAQVRNFAHFNYQNWLRHQGVSAVGYVLSSATNKRIATRAVHPLTRWRQHIQDIIAKVISNIGLAAIIAALTVGSRALMSTAQWLVFQRTGTSHLVAISGLHVGLVAMMGYGLGSLLWRAHIRVLSLWPLQKAASLAALLSAGVYCLMAGLSLPTQRALIMIAFILLLQLVSRFMPLSRRLLLAFLIIMVLEPNALYAVGFWLSFTAVASICYGCYSQKGPRGRIKNYWVMQKSILFGLSALTLGFFHQISLVAPLANLVAVPWVTFLIVPTALLACVLRLLSIACSDVMFHAAAWLLKPLWWWLSYLSHFHWAIWQQDMGLVDLASLAMAVLLLLAPKGVPGRWLAYFYLLPIFIHIVS